LKKLEEKMKQKYYCLVLVGGLEPVLHGPYSSPKILERKVKALHNKIKDKDSLIGLVFGKDGIPEVWSYSAGFFEED
jgi:hypothetical protein